MKETANPQDQVIRENYELYDQLISDLNDNSPQRTGLGSEEFLDTYGDSSVITVAAINQSGKSVELPVLMPTSKLYWYNQTLLGQMFPNSETYLYTQLPTEQIVLDIVEHQLQQGDIVVTNTNQDSVSNSQNLKNALKAKFGDSLRSESLEGAYLNQYVGHVTAMEGSRGFIKAPTFLEQFNSSVEKGELSLDPQEGPAVVETVDAVDADRLWSIYEKPFDTVDGISKGSPINAGFDRDAFYNAMVDPSVVKVINRHKGVITTLALFETDFQNAPWLNEGYYQRQFPDAHGTNNVLIFTTMVSDENMRGNAYSHQLIELLLKVAGFRESDLVFTFECNEVSSEYLPAIVEHTINGSGLGRVDGLSGPVSQSSFNYLQLTK